MNTNMIIARLSKKNKGQFFKMSYISDVPVTAQAKRDGVTVMKYTTGTMRWGLNYSNLKSVKAKQSESPVPSEHKLSWGEWDPRHKGLIINHKNKQYVRLYTSPNKNKSTFYLNGRPIEVEDLKKLGVVQNSYWNKTGSPDCLTIFSGNIQEIW